jgi:hypothetical protein
VRFSTPLQRTLVEPIGLRAFQRGLQSSLLEAFAEAFARPVNCGSGGLNHQGDLSVAERLCLGVLAYVDFEQDAGSVQLTSRGSAGRDELVQVFSRPDYSLKICRTSSDSQRDC